MTKKQNRSLGFGKRTLSVVLAALLILSTFAVVITTTSLSADASISYWFVSGNFNGWTNSATSANKINSGTGGSVTIPLSGEYTSSIQFKMIAEEGGAKWCGVAGSSNPTYVSANTKTELKWDEGNNIGISFPANTVSATFTLTVENGKNYVTVKPNTEGGGEGGDTGSMTYTAPVNTNNNDNKAANLFWATATYYDYLSDEEISNTKWLKPIQAGTGFNGSIDDWYPFYLFNRDVVKAAADSNSSWSLPLYFGNFCNTYNAYDTSHHPGVENGFNDATNDYNVTRFKYAPNNSNKVNADSARTGGGIAHQNESYQGLMNSSLDSSGNLMLPGGSVKAPYFDESALEGKAKVVKSSFPFTVKDEGSYKKYEFNSNNAKDNVYFTWNTSGSETYPTGVNYGAGITYGVKDGIEKFMNPDEGYKSGYGIFPFNNASNNNKGTKTNANENLNYGFGVRIDVNFRVPAPSSTVNTASNPIKFNFSGDDDLWMYITNNRTGESQLVLDMGGSHSKSTGEVNFNSLKAKVNNVYYNQTNVEQAFDFNYDDTYTMSVFYMERGLIESNMEMSFTLTPLGNNFIVTEAIDTTNVNEGIKDVITAISEFGFNPYDDNTAVTERPFNDFKLGNGGRMDIPNTILGINSLPYVDQYPPSKSYLSYSTSWTYWDNVSNNTRKQLDSGTTSYTSKHRMINESLNEYDYAELQVDYVNTPDVGTFTVEKKMAEGATAPAGKTFPATIYLKFKDGSFTPYTLVDDNGNTCTNGRVNLVPGQPITFNGIPTGTHVYVVEDEDSVPDYTASYNYTEDRPYIVEDTSSDIITVKNTPKTSKSTTATISGTKTLDGKNYSGDMFRFVLEGVGRFAGDADNIIDTSSTILSTSTVNNGTFSFSTLNFTAPGVYRYHVYEDKNDLALKQLDHFGSHFSTDFEFSGEYLVSITVSDVNFQLVASDPVYYAYNSEGHTMSSADFDDTKQVTSMTFANTLKKGSVKVQKKDQSGALVDGVVFRVYKVDSTIQNILDTYTNDADRYDAIMQYNGKKTAGGGMTGEDGSDGSPAIPGVAQICDLPIYQDGFVQTTTTGGGSITVEEIDYSGYQKYILMEIGFDDPGKYSINKTINEFTFPTGGQYDFTFSEDRAYVNGAIKNPEASGPGMLIVKLIGLTIVLFSAAFLGYYIVRNKKKAYQSAYSARHMRKK